MKFSWLFFILWTFSIQAKTPAQQVFLQKLEHGIPEWMQVQAEKDLAIFRRMPLSLEKLQEYYDQSSSDLYLVKFMIANNKISHEYKGGKSEGLDYRLSAYARALNMLARVVQLPDTMFLISMHDAFTLSTGMPIFTMCKREQDLWAILMPDFEVLREKFQVLPNKDLTVYEPKWETKKSQLIWRGSTAQSSLEGELMRSDNVHRFSRIILCKLSEQYPNLIDAKFTFFAQGGELIPSLQRFKAKQMPFDDLIQYKYQIFIDGNVSPYSASGWKLLINSLLFKPDSPWIQWYYGALTPYDHYIPVEADLRDLVDQILWAKSHDADAQRIAKNCREFALSHITLPDSLLYLYYILGEYKKLY